MVLRNSALKEEHNWGTAGGGIEVLPLGPSFEDLPQALIIIIKKTKRVILVRID